MNLGLNKIKLTLLILVLVFIGAKGFGSDEVRKAIFHEYNDTTYLILHLFNFHPTEGSYSQGSQRLSGFNKSEILVYNLETRRLLVNEKYGVFNNESAIEILGCSDSIIWIYSMKYKSGLQGVNLFTFEKEYSQAQIYKNLSSWIGRFADVEWDEIADNFGFIAPISSLVVNNYQNKQYLINTNDFSVTEANETINIKLKDNGYITNSLFVNNRDLDFRNAKLRINEQNSLLDQEFIDGKFIAENNPIVLYNYFNEQRQVNKRELDKVVNKMSVVRASKDSEVYRNMEASRAEYEILINTANENIQAVLSNKATDVIPLINPDSCIFVLQASSEEKSAYVSLTCLKQTLTDYIVVWERPIPKMFTNVQAAKGSKEFKRVFGTFTPDPSFIHVEQIGHNVIIIHQMYICSVSIISGEINWMFRL